MGTMSTLIYYVRIIGHVIGGDGDGEPVEGGGVMPPSVPPVVQGGALALALAQGGGVSAR